MIKTSSFHLFNYYTFYQPWDTDNEIQDTYPIFRNEKVMVDQVAMVNHFWRSDHKHDTSPRYHLKSKDFHSHTTYFTSPFLITEHLFLQLKLMVMI